MQVGQGKIVFQENRGYKKDIQSAGSEKSPMERSPWASRCHS